MQYRVLAGVLAEAYGAEPRCSRGSGAVCVGVGTHACFAPNSEDQVPSEATGQVGAIVLVVWGECHGLNGAGKVA